MSVIGIEGTGTIVVEPDWESLFSDVLEIAAAKVDLPLQLGPMIIIRGPSFSSGTMIMPVDF